MQAMEEQAVKPRFMVWENVPGAFSSNKGEDFRIALEENGKDQRQTVSIPRPNACRPEQCQVIRAMDFRLPGVPWTLNTREYPNVSCRITLSQILEDNPHPKYFLSSRATCGILRRANEVVERNCLNGSRQH